MIFHSATSKIAGLYAEVKCHIDVDNSSNSSVNGPWLTRSMLVYRAVSIICFTDIFRVYHDLSIFIYVCPYLSTCFFHWKLHIFHRFSAIEARPLPDAAPEASDLGITTSLNGCPFYFSHRKHRDFMEMAWDVIGIYMIDYMRFFMEDPKNFMDCDLLGWGIDLWMKNMRLLLLFFFSHRVDVSSSMWKISMASKYENDLRIFCVFFPLVVEILRIFRMFFSRVLAAVQAISGVWSESTDWEQLLPNLFLLGWAGYVLFNIPGWWFGTSTLFSHILGIVIPIDFHIFQRGSNHQPDTIFRSRVSYVISLGNVPREYVSCFRVRGAPRCSFLCDTVLMVSTPSEEQQNLPIIIWCHLHFGGLNRMYCWCSPGQPTLSYEIGNQIIPSTEYPNTDPVDEVRY